MITWGIISACMAFVTTPMSFYVMRFLLGVAEAGFSQGLFFIFHIGFRLTAVAACMDYSSSRYRYPAS